MSSLADSLLPQFMLYPGMGQAGRVCRRLQEGAHLRVEGELRSREYETDNGTKVRTYVIVASSIMSLRSGQRDPEDRLFAAIRSLEQVLENIDDLRLYTRKGRLDRNCIPYITVNGHRCSLGTQRRDREIDHCGEPGG